MTFNECNCRTSLASHTMALFLDRRCGMHNGPASHLRLANAKAFLLCKLCLGESPQLQPDLTIDLAEQGRLLGELVTGLQHVGSVLSNSKVLASRKYFIDQIDEFGDYVGRWLKAISSMDGPSLTFAEQQLTRADTWQPDTRISQQISKLSHLNKKKTERIEALAAEIKLKDKVISDLSRQNRTKTGFIHSTVQAAQKVVRQSQSPQKTAGKSPVRGQKKPDRDERFFKIKHQTQEQGLDQTKELQIKLKNGLTAHDYRVLLTSLKKYRCLRSLSLYLKDYKLNGVIGQVFKQVLSQVGQLQQLLIWNHFEVCEGIRFQRIKGFIEAVGAVRKGRLVGGPWI